MTGTRGQGRARGAALVPGGKGRRRVRRELGVVGATGGGRTRAPFARTAGASTYQALRPRPSGRGRRLCLPASRRHGERGLPLEPETVGGNDVSSLEAPGHARGAARGWGQQPSRGAGPRKGPSSPPGEAQAVTARGAELCAPDGAPGARAGSASFRGARERTRRPRQHTRGPGGARDTRTWSSRVRRRSRDAGPAAELTGGGRDASARRIRRGPGSEGVQAARLPGPGGKARGPQCRVGHGTTGVEGDLALSGPGTAEGTAGRGWEGREGDVSRVHGGGGSPSPPPGADPSTETRRGEDTWKTV